MSGTAQRVCWATAMISASMKERNILWRASRLGTKHSLLRGSITTPTGHCCPPSPVRQRGCWTMLS